MRKISEKYFAFIPLLLLCAFYAYKAIDAPVHDFANYYFGGYFWGQNQFGTDIYFPYWFNKQIVALGHAPIFAGFAPNTPFLALLFYPLSFLSIGVAKLVFNSIGVVLFLYGLRRLAVFYKTNPMYILLIPVLFLIPIRNEIMFGQVYFLLFFFLAESWLAYEKGQQVKTAIFLSLAILLKVFPVLLVLIFLFRKQFKLTTYIAVCCILFILPTLLFCSVDTWIFYVQTVLGKASDGEIASAYVTNYQSVYMFLKQLFLFDVTENPGGLFDNPLIFSAILFVFKIKMIAIGWYVIKKVTSPLFVFSYWILACILISPYGSTYTFLLMLFPFLILVKTEMPKLKIIAFMALLFLINNIPLSVFMDNVFPLSYIRLFVLLAFFILMLSLIYQSVNWKMVAAVSLVSVAGFLTLAKNDMPESGCFLEKDSPLLVYDYKIENNKLTYYYWNQNGENAQTLPLEIASITSADLTRNRIYYYGKRIISDNSHKLKPVVINGNTLIYLSDYDRGIGFYTLRKAELR